jgi:hypothetical protein
MLDAVDSLPRLTASDDFIARTLALVPDVAAPAPHETPAAPPAPASRRLLRWVPAAAAAAVMLMAGGYWMGRGTMPQPGNNATLAVATTAAPQVVVRLVLVEPTAQTVAIVGDFNGWDPMQSPLERLDQGVWTTTLALTPGRYHYQFLVDGERWVIDPLARETTLDGFGARNSVLDVGA